MQPNKKTSKLKNIGIGLTAPFVWPIYDRENRPLRASNYDTSIREEILWDTARGLVLGSFFTAITVWPLTPIIAKYASSPRDYLYAFAIPIITNALSGVYETVIQLKHNNSKNNDLG